MEENLRLWGEMKKVHRFLEVVEGDTNIIRSKGGGEEQKLVHSLLIEIRKEAGPFLCRELSRAKSAAVEPK